MPASAGTALAAETPGTTSNSMPASASAIASSPPRPNTNGSPPFRRTTSNPSRASVIEQLVDLVLLQAVARQHDRVGRRLRDELLRHERVVDERIAVAHELEAANRDQPGIPGAGADERNGHASERSTSRWKKSRRSP